MSISKCNGMVIIHFLLCNAACLATRCVLRQHVTEDRLGSPVFNGEVEIRHGVF